MRWEEGVCVVVLVGCVSWGRGGGWVVWGGCGLWVVVWVAGAAMTVMLTLILGAGVGMGVRDGG